MRWFRQTLPRTFSLGMVGLAYGLIWAVVALFEEHPFGAMGHGDKVLLGPVILLLIGLIWDGVAIAWYRLLGREHRVPLR